MCKVEWFANIVNCNCKNCCFCKVEYFAAYCKHIAHCNLDLLRKQTYKVFSGSQKIGLNWCKKVCKQCLLQTMLIANIAHCKLVLLRKQTYTVFFWCAKNLNKFMQNGLQTMLIANIAHCNLVRKQRYKQGCFWCAKKCTEFMQNC